MMANLRLTWKKAYHTAPHASNRTARGSYAGHKHSTSQKNTQNYGYAHHFRKVFLETLVIKPTQSRPPFPCSRKSQTSPCSAVFCFPCTNASCSALRPATARASNAMEGLTRNKTLLFLKKWMSFHPHSLQIARCQLKCSVKPWTKPEVKETIIPHTRFRGCPKPFCPASSSRPLRNSKL